MTDRHIIAGSAGFEDTGMNPFQWRFGRVMRYALSVSGKDRPRICWIGTAHGDSANGISGFYGAAAQEPVTPSHLQLFGMPNVDPADHLLEQDVIWVHGGSVANLLAVWRVHGLDRILKEAWERGVVLAGVSAGSICWHVGGTTDSFGLDLKPVTNGLGWLPYSNAVHYESEPQRRPLFHDLIGTGVLPNGYATDDGVAIHYVGTDVRRIVTEDEAKFAYRVTRSGDGGIDEERLTPNLL